MARGFRALGFFGGRSRRKKVGAARALHYAYLRRTNAMLADCSQHQCDNGMMFSPVSLTGIDEPLHVCLVHALPAWLVDLEAQAHLYSSGKIRWCGQADEMYEPLFQFVLQHPDGVTRG